MADRDERKKDEDGIPEAEFDHDPHRDHESRMEKLPYPKSVFFIVTNEFCERFSYYGMKSILTIYLNTVLGFSEDDSTIIYHIFSSLCYFTPLLGAMLADSLLGKFKTIFYLSIVYAAGNIVLSLAATPPLNLPAVEISMLGLALIALGTGGIKPCVAAFGGDQFILPQQSTQLVTFFSLFYMAINSGSLLSTFITPILRSDVQCFGDESCYSLAFGVPAALMIVATLVFVAGKFMYREIKPTGNVVLKLCKCIGHAIGNRGRGKDHWLDNADDEYEQRFIEDVKIVLRILLLYIPLPVFWALFDQQGSRWTLQATRMDGVVFGYTIKPDQVQVLNPTLILLFIPLFDKVIYPLLAKCGLLKNPLHRLFMGGVLAGVAFLISGVLELGLESTYPMVLTPEQANLNFINTLPCPIALNYNGQKINIPTNGSGIFQKLEAREYSLYMDPDNKGTDPSIQLTVDASCNTTFTISKPFAFKAYKSAAELAEQHDTDEAKQGGSFSYMVTYSVDKNIKIAYGSRSDDRQKPAEGDPKVRFLVGGDYFFPHEGSNIPQGKLSMYVYGDFASGEESKEAVFVKPSKSDYPYYPNDGYASETITLEPVPHKKFRLVFGRSEDQANISSVTVDFEQEFDFKLGGSYIIAIAPKEYKNSTVSNHLANFDNPEAYVLSRHTITQESSIHMLWLLPQYIVLTAAEIMFSITGLEFSYSQAPVSMKSVMQSAWLMTVAFGNLIVVIIAEAKFFPLQSQEFFLFAGLMFVDMIGFAALAYRYVPAQLEDPTKRRNSSK